MATLAVAVTYDTLKGLRCWWQNVVIVDGWSCSRSYAGMANKLSYMLAPSLRIGGKMGSIPPVERLLSFTVYARGSAAHTCCAISAHHFRVQCLSGSTFYSLGPGASCSVVR